MTNEEDCTGTAGVPVFKIHGFGRNKMGKRIGFIGLGLMGGSMARNLIGKGQTLNVFDIDQKKVDSFKSLGAKGFASPGKSGKIVKSSLPACRIRRRSRRFTWGRGASSTPRPRARSSST